ncbi:MAG TPA: PQQ-binding-like beta-propeller repeat protein [Candidatus Brocadiia bacterium]|nr:PQQ-binding-like beta-propeller repeat protein [Candidatus Brocadiia bacterium]
MSRIINLLALAAFLCLSVRGAENLLANPEFESGTGGWSFQIRDAAAKDGTGNDRLAEGGITAGAGRKGNAYLISVGAAGKAAVVSEPVPVIAGKTYLFSFWARVETGDSASPATPRAWGYLGWYDKAGISIQPPPSTQTADGPEWTLLSVQAKSPPEAVSARAYLFNRTEPDGPGAPVKVYFDDVSLAESVPLSERISSPKRIYPDTALIADGKPQASIIAPDDPAHMGMAREIQAVVETALQVRLPIMKADDWTAAKAGAENVILIGHALNNPAILQLYGWELTSVDGIYPGEGGWALQTVSDPWGTGRNAIIVGASTIPGAAAATAEFNKLVNSAEKGVISRQWRVNLEGKAASNFNEYVNPPGDGFIESRVKQTRDALEEGVHTGATRSIAGAGRDYMRSGREVYAGLCAALIDLMWEDRQKNRPTHGGPWGMDADFNLAGVVTALDLIEESPSLTSDDRIRLTKIVAEYCNYWTTYWSMSGVRTPGLRNNHTTFTSLGLFFAGRYFGLYYPCREAEQWSEMSRLAFEPILSEFKAQEDSNSYQWIPPRHVIAYSLASGNMDFFKSRAARRMADLAIMTMDNLGYQVSFGDVGNFSGGTAEFPLWNAATWFYRDGRYAWALDKAAKVRRRQEFELNSLVAPIAQQEPSDLSGLQVFPVGGGFYKHFGGEKAGIPIEETFDKISMRAGFDPLGEYLLLDGLGCGGHRHYDGNCITRLSARGRIWLADCDYIKALPKFHCGVLVFRDGTSDAMPPFCRLLDAQDADDFAFSRSLTPDYAGADWDRAILWIKGLGFVVKDGMTARAAGNFSFRNTWHVLGDVAENAGQLFSVEQKEEAFDIVSALPLPSKLTSDGALGANWAGYPFADPIVHIRQQIGGGDMKPGEVFAFHTALVPRPSGGAIAKLAHCAGDGLVLEAGERRVWIGFGGSSGPLSVAGQGWAAEGETATIFSATSVTVAGQKLLESNRPVTISMRPGGRFLLYAREAAEVIMSLNRRFISAGGREYRPDHGKIQLRLEQGRTVFAMRDGASLWPIVPDIAALQAGTRSAISPTAPILPLGGLAIAWTSEAMSPGLLITNNAGYPFAFDSGWEITSMPTPAAVNPFATDDSPNDIRMLTDGQTARAENSVMWDKGIPVTLKIDLARPCRLRQISIDAWWGLTSSKSLAFATQKITVKASRQSDSEAVNIAEITDNGPHGDWGSPIAHRINGGDVEARYLTIELIPREGCGVYLAELEVRASPIGQEAAVNLSASLSQQPVITAADVDGDSAPDAIIGNSSGYIAVLGRDGRALWKKDAGSPVRAIVTGDVDGDGKPEVLAGTQYGQLFCFDTEGNLLWNHQFPQYKRKPVVRVLMCADLNSDGKAEIIAGTESWHFYCIDGQGRELWRRETVHASTCGAVADVDSDGRPDVLAGTEYYWWHCLDAAGAPMWGYSSRSGPRTNAVLAANLSGEGKREVVFAGADGNVHALSWDGSLLWKYNTGDEVTALAALPTSPDRPPILIAGSLSFSVYGLDGSGKCIWRRDMGDSVTSFCESRYDDIPVVFAAVENGHIAVISPEGRVLAALLMSSCPVAIAGAGDGVFAALADGSVVRLVASELQP